MPAIIERILIGYGSESGNARGLAQQLSRLPFLQRYEFAVQDLNNLTLDSLTPQDRLLIISSSFGDGEPPANADQFLARITDSTSLSGLHYAIFGLGDTAYPTFCGFSKALDAAFIEKQAIPFVNRVDADTDFDEFFDTWCAALQAVLTGNTRAGTTLHLQVTAYGEQAAYPARVISQTSLNNSPPYAFHIRLDIEGSGIKYRAGDNLYVLAQNDPILLSRIARWFGDETASVVLATKELRHISKSVLREIARIAQSDALKDLLKVSNRKLLEDYLYGKDILDLLMDFAEPVQLSPEQLASWLPDCLPRAYSIASHNNPNYVDLCIREVAYSLSDRVRKGTATGFLTSPNPMVRIFARSNPRFHLPKGADHPLILIGTGTGIAPLMALLEQREQEHSKAHTCLVFGDRRRDSDFLYQRTLARLQTAGILDELITAFSRDSDTRYYVQDALIEHGEYIWRLLEQGAHLYLCGNKQNLERSIEQALVNIAVSFGTLSLEEANTYVEHLEVTHRLHKELY